MNNEINNEEIIVNPEPDWSLLMFWEDITFFFQRLFELIKSIF